jgi:uncharacterized protein
MSDPAARVSAVIVKVASRGNLNCSYCYMYNHADRRAFSQPKEISDAVFDALLERIATYCDSRAPHQFRIGFHGGEPTLLGVPRFRELIDRARRVLGGRLRGFHLQTNATLIDLDWAEALRDPDIAVGVSLDGPPEVNDAERVDHAGRGTHAATLRGIERLLDAGIDLGVLCVIRPGASGAAVYDYFRGLGLRRIEFLLPDVSHDAKPIRYGGLRPTPVADYLLPVLDRWLAEDDPSIRIRFFEDLLYRILSDNSVTITDLFGNAGIGYLIIDTDGGIEANDAFRVCDEGVAASGLNVLTHGFDDLERARPIMQRFVIDGFALPSACRECPERHVCGGGYPPHRYSRARGFDNPSVWCADILLIIEELRRRLAEDERVAAALASA